MASLTSWYLGAEFGGLHVQVIDWLKGDKAPLIVLDESHKAKNLVTSKGE